MPDAFIGVGGCFTERHHHFFIIVGYFFQVTELPLHSSLVKYRQGYLYILVFVTFFGNKIYFITIGPYTHRNIITRTSEMIIYGIFHNTTDIIRPITYNGIADTEILEENFLAYFKKLFPYYIPSACAVYYKGILNVTDIRLHAVNA